MRLPCLTAARRTALALACAAAACTDGGVAAAASAPSAVAAHTRADAPGVSRFVLPAGSVSGLAVTEISALAWDADEQLLYAASDQGVLYHFRLQRDGASLRGVQPVFAARLTQPAGATAAGARTHFNAEGLAVRGGDDGQPGNSELIVALEEKPPRIARISPQGVLLGDLPVPPPADALANYRKKGRGLETVALHPRWGLVTAPESPLASAAADRHVVYAAGQAWPFAQQAQDSRLKGVDVLPDGSLLVLERSAAGSSKAVVRATLRRVAIAACEPQAGCPATPVAALPAGPDNFEGLALIDARHALIVSDNGGDAAMPTVFSLITLP